MLSKNDIKLYKSLKQKKFRKEYKQFIVEGKKSVEEAIQNKYNVTAILTTDKNFHQKHQNSFLVSSKEIETISSLKNTSDTLCIVEIPEEKTLKFNDLKNQLILILENIQDPGNLGTIIRIADWFGIVNIICSLDTVDLYNQKTIQATMGSFGRVNVIYNDLHAFIDQYKTDCNNPIYATTLEGNSIYKSSLSKNGAIVIGNEGKGISDSLLNKCSHELNIPKFGKAESLNAAVATAIICSEFKKTN